MSELIEANHSLLLIGSRDRWRTTLHVLFANALALSENEDRIVFLPWETTRMNPQTDSDQVEERSVKRTGYCHCYTESRHQSQWVSAQLLCLVGEGLEACLRGKIVLG
jgi:hypothetical protein